VLWPKKTWEIRSHGISILDSSQRVACLKVKADVSPTLLLEKSAYAPFNFSRMKLLMRSPGFLANNLIR